MNNLPLNQDTTNLRKFIFSLPLLPYGAIGEPHAHCTHLQITQASP
jgi:hypothetical protein